MFSPKPTAKTGVWKGRSTPSSLSPTLRAPPHIAPRVNTSSQLKVALAQAQAKHAASLESSSSGVGSGKASEGAGTTYSVLSESPRFLDAATEQSAFLVERTSARRFEEEEGRCDIYGTAIPQRSSGMPRRRCFLRGRQRCRKTGHRSLVSAQSASFVVARQPNASVCSALHGSGRSPDHLRPFRSWHRWTRKGRPRKSLRRSHRSGGRLVARNP